MRVTKKKHIVIFIVTLIILLFIVYFSVLHTFIKNTTYYEPVTIEIKGLDLEQFRNTNCHGISPEGRIISLKKDNINCKFYTDCYIHLNDIVFYCNDSIFSCVTKIKVNLNNKDNQFIINLSDTTILNENANGSNNLKQLSLKKYIAPGHTKLQIFLAIFMWSGWFRTLYILLFCAAFLFIFFIMRKSIFSLIKKTKTLVISNISKLKIERRPARLSLTFIVGIISGFVFFNNTHFNGINLEIKESTTQTIAVNFAHGHGFPKAGFIEDFKNYNITQYDPTGELTYTFLKEYKGAYIYHNPPIYELFIGSFYYVSGVNPKMFKQFQLLILILIISLLPLLGFKLKGKFGFWSGLIAVPIVLFKYHYIANQIEPNVIVILLIFLLTYIFEKTLLENKFYKIILTGLLLSFIVLTQLTFILLPILTFLYLFIKLIKNPNRKAIYGFAILLLSFITPILLWSTYASNHLNENLVRENSFAEVHNKLINRELNNQDVQILIGLEDYGKIKSTVNIINDGGWVGPLSVYENDLVNNIISKSLLYNKRIIIATKSSPDLLLIAHNEYCFEGKPSADWTKHKDSYYNNDNKNLSPYIRVFLFYINHPKHFFSVSINKIYNAFSSYNYLIITIWLYIINYLIHYLNPFFSNKRSKVIIYLKFLLSLGLLIIAFSTKISLILFYLTLTVLLITLFLQLFSTKFKQTIIPEIFIFAFLSILIFVIATFGLERYVIPLDFIFIYLAFANLLHFCLINHNYSSDSLHT